MSSDELFKCIYTLLWGGKGGLLVWRSPNTYSLVFPLDDSRGIFLMIFFTVLLEHGKIPQLAYCGVAFNFHTSISSESWLAFTVFAVQSTFPPFPMNFPHSFFFPFFFFFGLNFCLVFSY